MRITLLVHIVAGGMGIVSGYLAVFAPKGGPLHRRAGIVFVVFGTVALLSALGDVRMLRAGGVRGPRRLARHLWRMCFALFVAAGSFFLGQADEFPARLRVWPVLMGLSFLPLLLMAYWLWRVRGRRRVRGAVRVPEPEAAPRGARIPVAAG